MKINISSLKFKADKRLLNFIEEKVNKLQQFNHELIDGDVIMRVDNSSDNNNKTVEIKLFLKGEKLFAEKTADTFESATDQAVEALRRQLIKKKSKSR